MISSTAYILCIVAQFDRSYEHCAMCAGGISFGRVSLGNVGFRLRCKVENDIQYFSVAGRLSRAHITPWRHGRESCHSPQIEHRRRACSCALIIELRTYCTAPMNGPGDLYRSVLFELCKLPPQLIPAVSALQLRNDHQL